MFVTELGMVTLVRPLHPENAHQPMLVMELGMTVALQPAISVLVAVSMIALQLFRESKVVLPLSTVMTARSHPVNACEPMEVTELGMVRLVNPKQYSNAHWPMVVTELGMVTLVRLSHL